MGQDFEWMNELWLHVAHLGLSAIRSGRSEHLLSLFFVIPQFEMLTGSLPFQGKDRKETMALILK